MNCDNDITNNNYNYNNDTNDNKDINDNNDINDDNDTNDNNENEFFPHNIVVAATARMRRPLFLVHKSFSKYNGGCQIRVFQTEDDKFIQTEEIKVVKTEEEKNSHSAAHA